MNPCALLPWLAAATLSAGLSLPAQAQDARSGMQARLPPALGMSQPPVDAQMIQRGRYLAQAGDCIACHTASGGAPYAGGLPMQTPFGAIHSTNITPHPTQGIGSYTFREFDNAVRHGVRQDGQRLYPAMPYPSFAGITDEDMQDLYVYFMQGVEPVPEANLDNNLPWPLSVRRSIGAWQAMFMPQEPPPIDPNREPDWQRGAYLVRTLGHCGACHTPRGVAGQEKALTELDGATYLSGNVLDDWYAPGLPQLMRNALRPWSEDDFVELMSTGRNAHSAASGPMVDVIEHSMQHMREDDLRAMATYLLSLPTPDDATSRADVSADAQDAERRLADLDVETLGARLYLDNCIGCHRADGLGDPGVFPALRANPIVTGNQPDSLIHVILTGSAMAPTQKRPSALSMPAFAWRLSDEEVAELATFVSTAWDNRGPSVSAREVGKLRERIGATASYR